MCVREAHAPPATPYRRYLPNSDICGVVVVATVAVAVAADDDDDMVMVVLFLLEFKLFLCIVVNIFRS